MVLDDIFLVFYVVFKIKIFNCLFAVAYKCLAAWLAQTLFFSVVENTTRVFAWLIRRRWTE